MKKKKTVYTLLPVAAVMGIVAVATIASDDKFRHCC